MLELARTIIPQGYRRNSPFRLFGTCDGRPMRPFANDRRVYRPDPTSVSLAGKPMSALSDRRRIIGAWWKDRPVEDREIPHFIPTWLGRRAEADDWRNGRALIWFIRLNLALSGIDDKKLMRWARITPLI